MNAPHQQSGSKLAMPPSAGTLVRESHIPEELGLLAHSADELTSVLNQLEQRLGVVMSPGGIDNTAEAAPDAYRVPVAEDIRASRRRVQVQTDRLANILTRLEL